MSGRSLARGPVMIFMIYRISKPKAPDQSTAQGFEDIFTATVSHSGAGRNPAFLVFDP
jgi:hypothetical protein